MKTTKQLQEDKVSKEAELRTLIDTYKDKTEMPKEDKEVRTSLVDSIEALNIEIDEQKRADEILRNVKVAGSGVQDLGKDEKKAVRSFDFMKAVGELASRSGNLTGVEKEMIEEGISEAKRGGLHTDANSIVIPQKYMEKRTDVSQGTSAIAPTSLGGYTEALRENAIYENVPGINKYQLTGDFKLPVTAAQTLAWATENSAAADGGANFTSDTLTPFRVSGYVDISNEITIQNGPAATQAIMTDLGRAEANLINRAMFGASVTNAPPSLTAKSGVLTFTENAVFAANSSVFTDVVKAEQTIADDHGLGGQLSYVFSGDMLSQIKQAVLVAGLQPGMTGMTYNDYQTNNYLAKFTNGATTATGFFGDFSRVHFGRFGGLNILVDPYTVAGNAQIRLVVNSNVDWSLVQGAAFVKWTSLLA